MKIINNLNSGRKLTLSKALLVINYVLRVGSYGLQNKIHNPGYHLYLQNFKIQNCQFQIRQVFLAAIFILGIGKFSFAQKLILIPAETTINKADVFLSDIAKVSGFSPAELKNINNLKLASIKLPGKKTFISTNLIKIKLKQQKIFNFVIKAPLRVKVYREGYTLNLEELKLKVEEKIKDYFKQLGFLKVSISGYGKINPIILSQQDYKLNLIKVNGKGVNRNANLEISDGQNVYKLYYYFNIYSFKKIPVAAHKIVKDSTIKKNDLKFRAVNIFSLPANVVQNKKNIINKTAKKTLAPGEYFSTNYLGEDYLIKKGDLITVFTKKGNIKIETKAVAVQNGNQGDLLKISVKDSKKIITGKIINKNFVEVVP